jgi:hypothetical protein
MSEIDYSYEPPQEEEIFDNKNTYSEYWPPMGKNETPKDLLLDFALIGQAVLGIRAVLQPEKYDLSCEFVQRSIGIARTMGWISDAGVIAPADVMDVAFPDPDMKYNQ